MKKRSAEPTNRELLEAIHEVAEAIQTLAGLTDRRFTANDRRTDIIESTLVEHSKVLAQHTGALAEILVTVKRLDEERLVGHHRLNRALRTTQLGWSFDLGVLFSHKLTSLSDQVAVGLTFEDRAGTSGKTDGSSRKCPL